MAASLFGAAANKADNVGAGDFAIDSDVIPPASMLDGDLVAVYASEATGSGAITVTTTGGQTWFSLTSHEDASYGVVRGFWCRFNGAWGANPVFTCAHEGDFSDYNIQMAVFRPTNGANTWAVDVAESAATYTAPGSPFDVTTTGQTAIASSGVHIAFWTAFGGIPAWALQGGSWANVGGTQNRNTLNNFLSTSMAYLVFASPGASGNVTNRQDATGFVGWKTIVTFAEVSAATVAPPPRRMNYGALFQF